MWRLCLYCEDALKTQPFNGFACTVKMSFMLNFSRCSGNHIHGPKSCHLHEKASCCCGKNCCCCWEKLPCCWGGQRSNFAKDPGGGRVNCRTCCWCSAWFIWLLDDQDSASYSAQGKPNNGKRVKKATPCPAGRSACNHQWVCNHQWCDSKFVIALGESDTICCKENPLR